MEKRHPRSFTTNDALNAKMTAIMEVKGYSSVSGLIQYCINDVYDRNFSSNNEITNEKDNI